METSNYNIQAQNPYRHYEDQEEEMEDDFDAETLQQMQNEFGPKQYYAQQMSPADYRKQTEENTKAAVDALVQSPEYQRVFTRCQLCWCSWSEQQCSENCMECGGYTLTRPCPICSGKCDSVWTRDVQLSHSMHEAHWDGECSLPWEERKGYMFQTLIDEVSEDSLLDGIEDLTT